MLTPEADALVERLANARGLSVSSLLEQLVRRLAAEEGSVHGSGARRGHDWIISAPSPNLARLNAPKKGNIKD